MFLKCEKYPIKNKPIKIKWSECDRGFYCPTCNHGTSMNTPKCNHCGQLLLPYLNNFA